MLWALKCSRLSPPPSNKVDAACAESHDRDTFIASSIAELMFPASQHHRATESRAGYTLRVRELYRKTILVPLRKCLDVPEVLNPKQQLVGYVLGLAQVTDSD